MIAQAARRRCRIGGRNLRGDIERIERSDDHGAYGAMTNPANTTSTVS